MEIPYHRSDVNVSLRGATRRCLHNGPAFPEKLHQLFFCELNKVIDKAFIVHKPLIVHSGPAHSEFITASLLMANQMQALILINEHVAHASVAMNKPRITVTIKDMIHEKNKSFCKALQASIESEGVKQNPHFGHQDTHPRNGFPRLHQAITLHVHQRLELHIHCIVMEC